MRLDLIEILPEQAGTTWTKTTVYEGRRLLSVHVWADNIITSRLASSPATPTTPHLGDDHEPIETDA